MKERRKTLKTNAALTIRTSPVILAVTLAYVALSCLISFLQYRISNSDEYMQAITEMAETYYSTGIINMPEISPLKPMAAVIIVLLLIASVLFAIGYKGYLLTMSRFGKAGFKDIFNAFTFGLKAIVINILISIICGVAAVFFVFPGVILGLAYSQAFFVMFDNPDKGPIWCMRESRRLMKGKKGEFFVLNLSFIGWYIVDAVISAIFLPVAQLWLAPYLGLTQASFYNELVGVRSVNGAGGPTGGSCENPDQHKNDDDDFVNRL